MALPAFHSRSDCPIPFVPDIEPDLIQDCKIPPIPDPFFQAPELPPIVPPITLGCPPISVSASARKMPPDSPLKFSASASTYDPSGDECFPEIDMQIYVPFGCPKMSAGESNSPSVGLSPDITFNVVQTEDDAPECAYEFDLDITFPCTSLNMRSVGISRITLEAEPTLDVDTELDTDENTCKLDFDIQIGVPGLDGVGNNCSGFGFIESGDLYTDSNILYFSCAKVSPFATTSETGTGQCLDFLSLSYLGGGEFAFEIGRTSCSAVYC